jgi:hypothetical protein
MTSPAVAKKTAAARKTNGRTTPKKRLVYTHPDGDEYALSGKVNTFLLLKIQAGIEDEEFNGSDIYRLIIGMVTDADRSKFITKLSRNIDFDAEALNETMTDMLEVVAGRNPSRSQSGSGRTAKQNTSRALSAAK